MQLEPCSICLYKLKEKEKEKEKTLHGRLFCFPFSEVDSLQKHGYVPKCSARI